MIRAEGRARHAAIEAVEPRRADGGELLRRRLVGHHDRDRGELRPVRRGKPLDGGFERGVERLHGRIVDRGPVVLEIVHG